ncbi:MAG: NAD(P)H-dependent oxidoreductase [Proteobacteria bacterium]|nr:NAD(P)H-dependent oxidoreductase [Pseudomonadota bacterium]
MPQVRLSKEAERTLQKIIAIWPKIMHQQRKEKILTMLSLLMGARKARTADQALIIEAVKLIVPKSYDPFFHMMENMEKFKRLTLDPFDDMQAYAALPIKVKRWESPRRSHKKATAKKKKVIAFCASPRRGGNTDILIDEALCGARDAGYETEKIMLQKIKLGYCIGCRKCKDKGYEGMCTVKDDMTPLYQKIMDADAVIIGFPIYTGRECAQLSTFMDRWDCFERFKFGAKLQPGRVALVIGTWGYAYDDTYDHIIENIMVILKLHKVETIEALSACGFEGILHGLDEKCRGVIAKFPKELKKAYDAGAALVTGR